MKPRYILVFSFFLSILFADSSVVLKFVGNKKLSDDFLYSHLNLIAKKAWYDSIRNKSYSLKRDLIKPLKSSLINLYKNEGFYDVSVDMKEMDKGGSVIFYIKEGRAVKIRSIKIDSDFDIKSLVDFKVGDRFVASRFISSRESIKRALYQKGFCNYDLKTKAFVNRKRFIADLLYKVRKNIRCKFGKIEIKSSDDIPKRVILSRLFYKTNDPYFPKKVNETYNNLLALEAFDEIDIKQSNFGDKIDTSIKVTPVKSKISKNIGIGYETKYGVKSVLHWEERNFYGGARKISFDVKYSKNDRFIKNTFFNPAFFYLEALKGYVDLQNEFAYSSTVYSDFKEKKFIDKVHFQKDLERFFLDFGIDVEDIRITKDSGYCAINDGTFFLISPYLKAILDERDSKIDPKNGLYLSSYLESGLRYIGSSSSYFKLLLEGRVIKTVDDFTFAFKSKVGVIDEFSKELPESKLFFAGGSFSNRAYGYNKLGATNAKCDGVGGKTLIDNSFEIDHPLYKKIFFAVFWDSTMLSADEMDFKEDFVNAYGFGLRYKSIVGPLKFDIGFNSKDSSIFALHFQIGQSF